MSSIPLNPKFRHVANCLACLLLLVAVAAALALGAAHLSADNHRFDPHSTAGALILLGLFGLASLDFIALVYTLLRAAIEFYRQPDARTQAHGAVLVVGTTVLLALGTFLRWSWSR